MTIYYGFGLLAVLFPMVVISVIAEMTTVKLLIISCLLATVLTIYFILVSEWFSNWDSEQNIVATLLVTILSISGMGFWKRSVANKRIRNLDWDENMSIDELARIFYKYFNRIGWRVIKQKSPVEFCLEFKKLKFAAVIYNSEMTKYYDNEKIYGFILSETRLIRTREKCEFAVVSLFDLPAKFIDDLKLQHIQFVFYPNIPRFVNQISNNDGLCRPMPTSKNAGS